MLNNDYLTQKQVAQRFGVTERTVMRWRAEKVGPAYYRFAGTIRYRKSDVEEYEHSSKVEHAG